MNMHRSLTGALLLLLAACGGAETNSAGNAQGGTANGAATADAGAPATNAAEEAEHGHVQESARVLLIGDGLLSDGTDAGAIRFGASRSDAIRAVARTLGEPVRINNVEDCGGSGAAQAADWGPLVLFFQNDRFVGWEQRDSSEQPWIGTPGGATIGSRRPTLRAAFGTTVSVRQTSLGTEFSGDGVSGLLASDRPDAQVDRLWAGNNCAMR